MVTAITCDNTSTVASAPTTSLRQTRGNHVSAPRLGVGGTEVQVGLPWRRCQGWGNLVETYRTFRLGRTTFAVSGDGAFGRAVAAELRPVASDDSKSPELIFHFLDSMRRGSTLPGQEEFDGRQMRASLSWAERHCPVVYVAAMLPVLYRAMPRLAFRSIHPAFIDRFEHLASGFLYQVFNGLVQALNLSANQSFVHTAAVEREGNRVAIFARGGMGKTGSLLRLVHDHGWRYLSDDWTILDDSGVIQLSHKSIQVHPRNLSGLSDGEKFLLKHRSFIDRWAWNTHRRLLNRRGVKRRSQAAALFGPARVGSVGPLSAAYLVERGDVNEIHDDMADINYFVSTTAEITARELAPSLRLLGPQLTAAAPESFHLDSFPARTEAIIRRAFERVTLRVLTVPRSMPEPQIEDYLVRTVAKAG